MQTTAEHGLVSPVHQMKTLIIEEGPTAFYKGLPLPLMGAMLETAFTFAILGQVKTFLYGQTTAQNRTTTQQTCIAGGITGLFNSFLLTPIELVKCRMQISGQNSAIVYKSTAQCVVHSFRSEGIGVFCKFMLHCLSST